MRRTIFVLFFILLGVGGFLWLRHRSEDSGTASSSKWDATMDALDEEMSWAELEDGDFCRAVPYFFTDIGQAAVGKPIPGLPEFHPLTLAQANLSQRIYAPVARTARSYVGPAGEDYDPVRLECRAAAAILMTLYTEPEHVPILPLGLFWAGTLLGDRGHDMRTTYLERTEAHSRLPRCTIHCYRLQRADIAPAQVQNQPLAFVLKNGDEFVGAFCVERNEQTGFFELKFLDHEGLPLVVNKFGPELPDESAVLGFVQDFMPTYSPNRGSYLLVYSVMRAEVEAHVHLRNEVTPLAARWAAYALFRWNEREHDLPESAIATQLRDELRTRRAWAWKIESDDECGQRRDPRIAGSVPEYRVQGYRNMSLEDTVEAAVSKMSDVEHYHFTVFSTAGGFPRQEYLFSYRLMSRIENGTRQIALEQLEGSIPLWLESFDAVPTFEEVRVAVTNYLESKNH